MQRDDDGEHRHAPPIRQQAALATHMCPPYGSKSIIGRRAKMEDTCVAVPYLFEVPLCSLADELLPPRIAPALRSSAASAERSSTAAATTFSGGDTEDPSTSSAAAAPATDASCSAKEASAALRAASAAPADAPQVVQVAGTQLALELGGHRLR